VGTCYQTTFGVGKALGVLKRLAKSVLLYTIVDPFATRSLETSDNVVHAVGLLALVVICAVNAASGHTASAQQTDSAARPRTVRFTGTIASMSTTRPVSLADVRIVFIDSAHADKDDPKELGEVFVDSSKSRIGITDTSGAFTIRNVLPGHYLINVRRLGFAPFDGVLTIDTLSVDMELTLTQIAQILPRVTISSSASNKVTERLDRVGFVSRSHMGTSGTFIDRNEILRRKRNTSPTSCAPTASARTPSSLSIAWKWTGRRSPTIRSSS
jgi:hypothetical protein